MSCEKFTLVSGRLASRPLDGRVSEHVEQIPGMRGMEAGVGDEQDRAGHRAGRELTTCPVGRKQLIPLGPEINASLILHPLLLPSSLLTPLPSAPPPNHEFFC